MACLFGFCVYSQSPNCAKFKNGKFKTIINGRTSIIERSGSVQKEVLFKLADSVKMTFEVKWIDDCRYSLKPVKEWFDKHPQAPKNMLITVKIIATSPNSYTQTSSSNFSPQIVTSEMIKIP
jgi:hypothetical protein